MAEAPLETLAEFEPLIAEVMAEWKVPGLALAVLQKDRPPLLGCWGVADIGHFVPQRPDLSRPVMGRSTSLHPNAAGSMFGRRKQAPCLGSTCA